MSEPDSDRPQQQCLIDVTEAQGCDYKDFKCSCAKTDAISDAAFDCVTESCGFFGAFGVQTAAQKVCSCESRRK